jgi:hypothetical protein
MLGGMPSQGVGQDAPRFGLEPEPEEEERFGLTVSVRERKQIASYLLWRDDRLIMVG